MRTARPLAVLVKLAFACFAVASCELFVDASMLDSEDGVDGGDHRDAGDASRPADAGDGGAFDAACPGHAGPPMIRVGSFCIDITEVTNSDYEAFLASQPSTVGQPPQCTWKPNYDHNGAWVPGEPTVPAGSLDWCDAYVYCLWAGKRLCGNISGGSVPFAAWADAGVDEWFAACTGADASAYPYGNTFNETACNGRLADGGYPDGAPTYTVQPVESRATCQGGYPGVFDMSGNVGEWEDCCEDSGVADAGADLCRHRGGSANSDEQHLRCDAPNSFPGAYYHRASLTDDVGFRCCSP